MTQTNRMKQAMKRFIARASPKLYLKMQTRRELGYCVDFKNPRRFNEHLQVRKLAKTEWPKYARLADKLLVKNYVASLIGEQHVIPTLWSGTRLPDEPSWSYPFVIKANHGSGWNAFVRTHDEWLQVKDRAQSWVSREYFPELLEPWYDLIDRALLIEPMIGENIRDYKLFCFRGKVRTIQVDADRFKSHARAFFTPQWEREPFTLKFPSIDGDVPRPQNLGAMIRLAEVLSQGMSFVRMDFYDLPDGPKFGEFTFAPESGFGRFSPDEYDLQLGALWPTRGQHAS